LWPVLPHPPLCGVAGMTLKSLIRLKVSNVARHDRFVAMTQQIGAVDDVKDFERAFQKAFKNAFENAHPGRRTNGAGLRRRLQGNFEQST
jgi:hypothetical protein